MLLRCQGAGLSHNGATYPSLGRKPQVTLPNEVSRAESPIYIWSSSLTQGLRPGLGYTAPLGLDLRADPTNAKVCGCQQKFHQQKPAPEEP